MCRWINFSRISRFFGSIDADIENEAVLWVTQEAKMSHCGKKTSERNFSASEDEIQACFGYDESRPNRAARAWAAGCNRNGALYFRRFLSRVSLQSDLMERPGPSDEPDDIVYTPGGSLKLTSVFVIFRIQRCWCTASAVLFMFSWFFYCVDLVFFVTDRSKKFLWSFLSMQRLRERKRGETTRVLYRATAGYRFCLR